MYTQLISVMHVYLHVDHVYMQQINTALNLTFKTFMYFKGSN